MILQPDHICIDYSFARPAPQAIVAAGVKTVVRYISPTRKNPKNLTVAERDALHRAGLGILLVWENGATDPLAGAPLGAAHGLMARNFALDLDYPQDIEIIVAVDFDVQPQLMNPVLAYLKAFKDATGWPQGTYGKDTVVAAAHDAGVSTLGWQTVAWSKGKVSPHAHVLQHARIVHPPVGSLGAVDDNTVLRPFKAWSSLPDPPPVPPPVPPQGDQMSVVIYDLTNQDSDTIFEGYANEKGLNLEVWSIPLDQAGWDHIAAATALGAVVVQASVGNMKSRRLSGPLPTGDARHTWVPEDWFNVEELRARTAPAAATDAKAREDIEFVRKELATQAAEQGTLAALFDRFKAGLRALGAD